MAPYRPFRPSWAALTAALFLWGLIVAAPIAGPAGGVARAADPPPLPEVAMDEPAQAVGILHAKLLECMKDADKLGYQGRFDLLHPTLLETFDLDFMASKSVGRGWKKLDEEQKKQWQEAFARLITANFAGRFEGYSGQSFETIGEEEAAHGTMLVLTKIIDPGKDDIALNYRMQETDEHWRIVDVYFNGTVSELAMRRSEYSSMLKRDGFDKLIEAVDQRIVEFASGKVD